MMTLRRGSPTLPLHTTTDYAQPSYALASATGRIMTRLIGTLAALAALAALTASAGALDWPTRPVTMVVPFAAGGGTDVLGRIVGRRLSEVIRQQVVIDNDTRSFSVVNVNTITETRPFNLGGTEFQLGQVGQIFRTSLAGQLDPVRLTEGHFAGYAVGVPSSSVVPLLQ